VTGAVFGILTVMEAAAMPEYTNPTTGRRTTHRAWICRCACGREVTVRQSDLAKRQHCGAKRHGITNGFRGKRSKSALDDLRGALAEFDAS
jgi:hypothetical protein